MLRATASFLINDRDSDPLGCNKLLCLVRINYMKYSKNTKYYDNHGL